MKKDNKEILWLLAICILVFFINLDAIFVNIMEARNFITAREMIQEGNWIFTTLNDMPRYQKPPLPTWLTALSGMVFGLDSLFGLRVPAAILGLIGVLMTYFISFKITGEKRFSFVAGLIAVTSFHIIFSGRDGQWDIFTHGFMLVSILYIIKLFSESNYLFKNALVAGLFFGLSFLSKGPVSLYAMLLPFLIAYGVVFKFSKGRLFPLLVGVLVAVLVSGSWSLYVYLFDTRAVSDITSLEAGRWINYNVRPLYYYWSFVVQSGLWTIPAFVGLLYPYLKDKVFHKKGYQFSLLWTLAAVVLLSLIPEKKSRYLLPVLFPLAINTAFYMEYLFRSFKSLKAKETWPVYFHFGLLGLIGIAIPIGGYLYLGESLQNTLIWFFITAVLLFGIGVYIILNLFRKNIKRVFYASIAFIVSVMCFGMPIAKEINPNTEYRGPNILNNHIKNLNVPVYEFYNFVPELIWEYEETIPVLHNSGSYILPKEEAFLLLVRDTKNKLEEANEVFTNYNLKKLDSIDVNPTGNRRSRLKRIVFYVSKK
ncbi:MAG: phospholipid carrier-dependent glycosyltransferase [Flavobacteriaceae bacterium]|nr:phospholipid carrier-dependent glycosyltransferase [Flavobacteriaceae bacterium]